MNNLFNRRALVAIIAAGAAANAMAVQPKPVKISEGITLTPTLESELRYDDNIYEANVSDSSSWVASISPNLLLDSVQGRAHYQLGYSFDTELFDHSDQDSDTDHFLKASAEIGINRSNRLSLNANYSRVENVADTSVVGENDKFETSRVAAIYGLGNPSGLLSLDIGANHEWFRTFNSGTINRDREYDKPGFNATGYYRLGPKTRALLEYRYDDYDYLQAFPHLDSDKNTVLVGVIWSATRQTTGSLKFGQEKRDFDDAGKKDRDGSTWEADVLWQPGPRSTLSIGGQKGTEEGSVTEDLIDATRARVSLYHELSRTMSLDTFYRFSDEDYQDLVGREDEVNEAGISLRYNSSRWMSVGIGYTYKDRDSNQSIRDYDRNVYMINLNLSL
ncbi:MAG: outer membrane beta-barrel protein [Porticoccaceae bacterium]